MNVSGYDGYVDYLIETESYVRFCVAKDISVKRRKKMFKRSLGDSQIWSLMGHFAVMPGQLPKTWAEYHKHVSSFSRYGLRVKQAYALKLLRRCP